MTFNGAFRERVRNSWVEMRENLTRSVLQSLGVILGVAAVLGGMSISDSMRRRSMELYVKMGGLDKLNIRQSAVVREGAPTALQMANLGLRSLDADEGGELDASAVHGISVRKDARARVRSPYADEEREVRGIGGDFLALDGYEVEQGRASLPTTWTPPPRSQSWARRPSTRLLSERRRDRPDDCASATRRSRWSACSRSASSASASPTATCSAGATASSRSRRRSWRGDSRATSTIAWTASPSASRTSTRWRPSPRGSPGC